MSTNKDIELVPMAFMPPIVRGGAKSSKYLPQVEKFIKDGNRCSQVTASNVSSGYAMLKIIIKRDPKFSKKVRVFTQTINGERGVYLAKK